MDYLWPAIEKAKVSLFRFEGLQDYSGEDGDEAVSYFLKTGQLLTVPDNTNDWWRNMKARRERGVVTSRVRLVSEPLTDYTKMELAYLQKAKAYSGDDVRTITLTEYCKIVPKDLPDFYLIDDQVVFTMQYGPLGTYLGSTQIDTVSQYRDIKDALMARSVPL